MQNTLKIQIWSDIMCPFCYIGKRRLEAALEQFQYKDAVEIEWKSFQLDANFVASPDDNLVHHLAEKYRKDNDWAKEMLDNMTQNAANSGLDFHFEKAVMANSYHAHRLLHYAKRFGREDGVKELLFKAYLTDGLNINDTIVLKNIGVQAGLDADEVEAVLQSNAFANEVQQDIAQAQNIGVQGVPFFVFDAKYAISGAQHEETFLNTLNKVWDEGFFDSKITLVNTIDGDSCGFDGCN